MFLTVVSESRVTGDEIRSKVGKREDGGARWAKGCARNSHVGGWLPLDRHFLISSANLFPFRFRVSLRKPGPRAHKAISLLPLALHKGVQEYVHIKKLFVVLQGVQLRNFLGPKCHFTPRVKSVEQERCRLSKSSPNSRKSFGLPTISTSKVFLPIYL